MIWIPLEGCGGGSAQGGLPSHRNAGRVSSPADPPRDDFLEVVKSIVCDPEDIMDEASIMMDELNEIVDRYGALADDCGPIDVDHISFRYLLAR